MNLSLAGAYLPYELGNIPIVPPVNKMNTFLFDGGSIPLFFESTLIC